MFERADGGCGRGCPKECERAMETEVGGRPSEMVLTLWEDVMEVVVCCL